MTQGTDPLGELLDLWVTEPASPRDRQATAEVAVVGSLPVRASLWLTTYADALARELGPTALIRLDEERPSLHLLRGRIGRAEHRWASLAEAVAALGREVVMWIVRPPLDASPRDIVASGSDRITILTTDNDTARVDAYARITALAGAAEQAGCPLPALGVAMVGADRRDAAAAHEALAQTARTYLAVELPLVACIQRIDEAIRTTAIQSFDPSDGPGLSSVLRWINDARSRAARPAAAAETDDGGRDVAAARPDLPVPQPRPAGGDQREEAPRRAAPTLKLPPKPSVELEPKEPATVGEPDDAGAPITLASYVEEVAPLDVRCPGHERVELAADAAGRLHVIAREADLRDLHVVEAWARAHRELIDKACPGHWIDPAARTVCHVFTDRPASVADLHGSDLRLHVLAPVVVEGRRGWYAAPLNAAVR